MNECRLYVANIPPNTSEHELKAEFGYYGKVKSVDLKTKNDDNFFGFINIEIEERLLQKCIREFGQQQFKGNFLSISKAKENFLERLKKEREQIKGGGGSNEDDIGKRLIEISRKSNAELEMEKSITKELPTIEKDVSSDESSSEEEEEIVQKPVKPKVQLPRQPISFSSYSYQQEEPVKLDQATIDDMKRQQSLQKLKDMHKEKKNIIKNALLSIDSTAPRNNKIIFERPEPEELIKPVVSKKAQLFEADDDEEEDEETNPESFKLKKQFAGKNGEKLFELQTRYQNDKRFKIDEKFAETTDEFVDSRKKYTREELKERKRMRKEMANWDQNELKEERDHQLGILESITGESTAISDQKFQKPQQKAMLRFDPSNKSHSKYLDIVTPDEELEDVEMRDDDEEISTDNNQNPTENGDGEKFYVAENLTEAFKPNNSDKKPFSVLDMLGIKHDENNDESEDEVEEKPIKVPQKVQAFRLNKLQFKYDSSDTDEEAEAKKEKMKRTKEPKKKSIHGKYSKSGVWRQNFFIADGDERLQRGFEFIRKGDNTKTEASEEKRKLLRKKIKTQIRKARNDKEKSSKKRKVKKIQAK